MTDLLIAVESTDIAVVEQFAAEVRAEMAAAEGAAQAAVGHWLAAGRTLLSAREAGEYKAVYEAAGLTKSTASKLATIAGRFGDVSPGQLPTSWTTLYELSRADEDVLENAIESGVVGPDMTKREASDLASSRPDSVDSDPDEGSTMEDRPEVDRVDPVRKFAEDRDAAVFSVEKRRLEDAVALVTAPGFRLTVEVGQDLLRALRPLEDARSALLQVIDDEAGEMIDLPPFHAPRRIIPISDPRDQTQIAGTTAFEGRQAPHSVV